MPPIAAAVFPKRLRYLSSQEYALSQAAPHGANAYTSTFIVQDDGWFYGKRIPRHRLTSSRIGTSRSPACPRTFPPAKSGILKQNCDSSCLSRVSSISTCSSDEEQWESRYCTAMQQAKQACGPRLAQHKLEMSTVRLAYYMFADDAATLGLTQKRTGVWAQCGAFGG